MNEKEANPLKYSVHTRLREFRLKRLLPNPRRGRLLLDIGCGLGYLTEALGEGFTRIGMDHDIHSLKINRERDLKNMVQGDATKLPFKERSLDIVICSEVLEHLPDGMDESALVEIARILKPGGRLLITVPSLEGVRAASALRNLGHDDQRGGEYHYRNGYTWQGIKTIINRIPQLNIRKKHYAMFLFSELFMDLLKWVYLRKNRLKEHSDIIKMEGSFLFRLYRIFFPLLYFGFICEDMLLAPVFKGHILILVLERTVNNKK